ncbi:CYtochrome P450 family [Caenorhabditis elegans]|uniref:CYtochrome P450 family n=1 Tax=Caenorhabditis elegans TaxID=6239 RepID=O44651_CAEEL|nr:CYtochrome P450 family [Caenorhabditis elegans]CCD72732.1 CYtochrome P450 family [Caenorhabditis elegans]|eukprot:NP_504094.1 CYtochrome P450 family [Caenorhabditis elegans]
MIVILLLTTLIAFLVARQYQKAKKLPPGPVSLPLIGNIPQLVYYIWREKGVVPAFDLFRQIYGDVFTIWLGPIPHVSICDYDTSQEVFVKNGSRLIDRFLPPVFLHLSNNLGLVSANGEVWAEMRRFTLLAFRNIGVGRDSMEERILEELDARCEEIDADAVNGKTVVQTSDFFDLAVGSIINNTLIGKRFNAHNKDEFMKLKKMMDSASDLFTIFDLTAPVWMLKILVPKRCERILGVQEEILNFVSREANERYEQLKSGEYTVNAENPHDFVEAYFAKMEEEKRHGGPTPYTMKCLKHVIGDLWLAGQDTTTTTLVSGFNQLVNHPEVIRKCREEILRITENGSRPLQLKDRAESHYLNATITEIQRHASILNVNFWRLINEPTNVKGYEIDSGTVMTAQLGALHVNNDIFKNADKFYPERFIENGKLLNQVIPFGIGKRSCVGENLARSELYLLTGNLLLRYNIRPHGSLPSTADQLPYSAGKMPDKNVHLEFVKL